MNFVEVVLQEMSVLTSLKYIDLSDNVLEVS